MKYKVTNEGEDRKDWLFSEGVAVGDHAIPPKLIE